MFSLLYGIYQQFTQKPEFYVLIIGLDNAGKTTLLEKIKALFVDTYESAPPENIAPTVGLNIGRMELGGAKIIFWDLGGQSGLRTIWERYYSETNAIIYVVDAADHERISEARDSFEAVMQNEQLSGLPVLVCANKQDLPGLQDIGSIFDPTATAGLHPFRVQSICALNGDGVKDGVEWIVSNLRTRNTNDG